MRLTLLLFSIFLILLTVALAAFIEPRSGSVSGGGWTIPFWPFVLFISVVINPYIHDLVKLYFRYKVEIAKAENGIDDKKNDEPPPPPPPPPADPRPTVTVKK